MTSERYELIYWPVLQGRGEFVRLALEAARADYVDVARLPEDQGGGIPAVLQVLKGDHEGAPPFAPPILRHRGALIAQTAAILHYLAPRIGLAPNDEVSRIHALQYQLTITDWVAEAHDTHHPVSTGLYYEDQKKEAAKRAKAFREQRLPKFLGYFERALASSGGPYLFGSEPTYPDLSVFQVLEGLSYAFPRAFAETSKQSPGLLKLRKLVRALPNVAAYLASERRIPFNEDGIFRRYPELDSSE
jgi:glutathione S-transferase